MWYSDRSDFRGMGSDGVCFMDISDLFRRDNEKIQYINPGLRRLKSEMNCTEPITDRNARRIANKKTLQASMRKKTVKAQIARVTK